MAEPIIKDLYGIQIVNGLTVKQVSEFTGIDESTIRRYVKGGDRSPMLPSKLVSHVSIIEYTDMLEWFEEYKSLPDRGRRQQGNAGNLGSNPTLKE